MVSWACRSLTGRLRESWKDWVPWLQARHGGGVGRGRAFNGSSVSFPLSLTFSRVTSENSSLLRSSVSSLLSQLSTMVTAPRFFEPEFFKPHQG